MNIYFSKEFKKSYQKRIKSNKNLATRFEERYDLFEENSTNPILKDHALAGKLKDFRAFSITGDVRVIYYIFDEAAYFVDIGTHNQIYGK